MLPNIMLSKDISGDFVGFRVSPLKTRSYTKTLIRSPKIVCLIGKVCPDPIQVLSLLLFLTVSSIVHLVLLVCYAWVCNLIFLLWKGIERSYDVVL